MLKRLFGDCEVTVLTFKEYEELKKAGKLEQYLLYSVPENVGNPDYPELCSHSPNRAERRKQKRKGASH